MVWVGGGFPDSSGGKESTCSAGDPGLIPGSGRREEGAGVARLRQGPTLTFKHATGGLCLHREAARKRNRDLHSPWSQKACTQSLPWHFVSSWPWLRVLWRMKAGRPDPSAAWARLPGPRSPWSCVPSDHTGRPLQLAPCECLCLPGPGEVEMCNTWSSFLPTLPLTREAHVHLVVLI